MANNFDTQLKLFEILSNLSQYDSPEKIEELKTELRFLQEWDVDNSVLVVDYGQSLEDTINAAAGSVLTYLFCFPGFTGSLYHGDINSNLRFVPVSTAFCGVDFSNNQFLNLAYFIGANLRSAKFQSSNLSGCDLTGADLTNADLTGVYLTDAKIHSANFSGAKLNSAAMPGYADTISEFKAVVGEGNWNKSTIWINGSSLT